ncbi:MAG: hypothetical protein LKM37_09515 [Bacteroidales bacterium]|nr:hypothetical protein [Bacteroidales bacterium]MCI1733426.1 hypothetical protein [Bacteroidales bacterium]
MGEIQKNILSTFELPNSTINSLKTLSQNIHRITAFETLDKLRESLIDIGPLLSRSADNEMLSSLEKSIQQKQNIKTLNNMDTDSNDKLKE